MRVKPILEVTAFDAWGPSPFSGNAACRISSNFRIRWLLVVRRSPALDLGFGGGCGVECRAVSRVVAVHGILNTFLTRPQMAQTWGPALVGGVELAFGRR